MSEFRDVTVLITAAGNVFMPGTTSCLKNNGERYVRLIGADMNDDDTMLQMCDTYYKVPRGNDPSYVEALLDICRSEKVDILLPIMSVELNSLALNRERFKQIGTIVSVSEPEPLTIANNKLKLFNFMTMHHIPCANYSAVHSLAEFEQEIHKMGYPHKCICVKTVDGSGSRGFRILDEHRSKLDSFLNDKPTSAYLTFSEMKSILSEADIFPELMLMEYLPGREYTVDLLADHGKVLYSGCRMSLHMDNSIMIDGVVVDNKEINLLCNEVVSRLGLDGNIGFDLREKEDGTPVIMECNPRITAGIPTFYAAGLNLPYLNVKRILNERLPVCSLKTGTIVRRRWLEMYSWNNNEESENS